MKNFVAYTLVLFVIGFLSKHAWRFHERAMIVPIMVLIIVLIIICIKNKK